MNASNLHRIAPVLILVGLSLFSTQTWADSPEEDSPQNEYGDYGTAPYDASKVSLNVRTQSALSNRTGNRSAIYSGAGFSFLGIYEKGQEGHGNYNEGRLYDRQQFGALAEGLIETSGDLTHPHLERASARGKIYPFTRKGPKGIIVGLGNLGFAFDHRDNTDFAVRTLGFTVEPVGGVFDADIPYLPLRVCGEASTDFSVGQNQVGENSSPVAIRFDWNVCLGDRWKKFEVGAGMRANLPFVADNDDTKASAPGEVGVHTEIAVRPTSWMEAELSFSRTTTTDGVNHDTDKRVVGSIAIGSF